MKKITSALIAYLKDWKNLLTHSLIGAGIVLAAIFVPVHPHLRILFLLLVVGFNVIRMGISKKRAQKQDPA